MQKLTVNEILKAIGGKPYKINVDLDSTIEGVSTDSRKIKNGEVFFALKGENYDGHNFIKEAINKSCIPAVSEKKKRGNLIIVNDTLKALGDLARYYRNKVNPFVIAITGSVGKTTTKDFMGKIFSETEETLVSYRNYNNLVGVPLNILRLENEKIAVLELASNKKGEIEILSRMVEPDIGLITSIGSSHLEEFGDKNGVFLEKKSILEGLKGSLFINGDDDFLKDIDYEQIISFGFNPDNDYRCDILQLSQDGSIFNVNNHEFYIKIPGKQAVMGALGAISVALDYDIIPELIQSALLEVVITPHRMNVIKKGKLTIIDDTYNSNPDSLMNCMNFSSKFTGRKIAILGPMLELGDRSYELHVTEGMYLKGLIDRLIVIGEKAKGFLEGFGSGDYVENKEEAFNLIEEIIREGDVLIFKSSHSLHLETLVSQVEDICSITFTR